MDLKDTLGAVGDIPERGNIDAGSILLLLRTGPGPVSALIGPHEDSEATVYDGGLKNWKASEGLARASGLTVGKPVHRPHLTRR